MAVATLANEHAVEDLKLLLFTLELWNPVPPAVYIYTDSKTAASVNALPYKGKKVLNKEALNSYTGLNRDQMESMKGKEFPTLFADFCAEKPRLIAWALAQENGGGVFFCDADICHLGPLPTIPENVRLGLSPHMIKERDYSRFGYYNAGFLYMRDVETTEKWREMCFSSGYFEQSCLEDLRMWFCMRWSANAFINFPKQVNYGWWRLWQGDVTPDILQAEWRIMRKEGFSGISVAGEPLQCIHTHWYQQNDMPIARFNEWVLGQLRKLAVVKKTKVLVGFLEKQHPFLALKN
jgi:hypothetical protein